MLIEPTTTSGLREVKMTPGSTLQTQGTFSGETIAIEIPNGQGGWKSLTETHNGVTTTVVLNASNEQQYFYGNTFIRINKPATSNPIGVERYISNDSSKYML